MTRAGFAVVATAVAGAVSATGWGVPAYPTSRVLLPSFAQIIRGPAGGTIWQGVIPNGAYPRSLRPSLVYLPPGFTPEQRYPTFYVLTEFGAAPTRSQTVCASRASRTTRSWPGKSGPSSA